MFQIALYSFALLLSGSVRTPNETPNPLDYEYAAGLQIGKQNQAELWGWTERENGRQYRGAEGHLNASSKRTESRVFGTYREAGDVERVGISTSLKALKYYRLGFGTTWDHYDPAVTLNLGAQTSWGALRAAIYDQGVESIEGKLEARISPLEGLKWFSLVPTFKYTKDRAGTEFVQGKLVLQLKAGKQQ